MGGVERGFNSLLFFFYIPSKGESPHPVQPPLCFCMRANASGSMGEPLENFWRRQVPVLAFEIMDSPFSLHTPPVPMLVQ